MQLRQLEYFRAVADAESISAAAGRLHVVQSGVSSAIRSLERELGSPLFDRGPRGVRLNAAGHALVPLARQTLADAAQAAAAVDEVRRGLRGIVTIGALPVLGLIDLTSAIAEFRGRHPHVSMRLVVAGSHELVRAIDHGEVDFALLSPVGATPDEVRLEPVASASFVALSPLGDASGADVATLPELAASPFIDAPRGFGTRDLIDEVFARAGLRRDIGVEAPDAAAIPVLVAKGAGVAIVPDFVAGLGDVGDALAVRPLDPPLPAWTLFLGTAVHTTPSRAAAAFMAMLRAVRRGG